MAALRLAPAFAAVSGVSDIAVCRTGPLSSDAGEGFLPRAASGTCSLGRDAAGRCGPLSAQCRGDNTRASALGGLSAAAKLISRGQPLGAAASDLRWDALRRPASRVAETSLSGMRYAGRKGVLRVRSLFAESEGSPRAQPTSVGSFGHEPDTGRGEAGSAGLARSLEVGAPVCHQTLQSAMSKAFSSMVLMLKALQSYALQMRSMLYYEDVESVALVVHREMQASLLWLFQQVFACTPVLMVAVMILFSEFTLHSAISAVSPEEPSLVPHLSAPARPEVSLTLAEVGSSTPALEGPWTGAAVAAPYSTASGDGYGGKGGRAGSLASGFGEGEGLAGTSIGRGEAAWLIEDEEFLRALSSQPSSLMGCTTNHGLCEDNQALVRLLESTVEEMGLQKGVPVVHLRLDPDVVRRLVAPVSIDLEEDNYTCFDRTDLEYQSAIAEDPRNPMLLSNYAQFLMIVRRDYDRSVCCPYHSGKSPR